MVSVFKRLIALNRGCCYHVFLCAFPTILLMVPAAFAFAVFGIKMILQALTGKTWEDSLKDGLPAVSLVPVLTSMTWNRATSPVCGNSPVMEEDVFLNTTDERMYLMFDGTGGSIGQLTRQTRVSGFLDGVRQMRKPGPDYCVRTPAFYTTSSESSLHSRFEDDLRRRLNEEAKETHIQYTTDDDDNYITITPEKTKDTPGTFPVDSEEVTGTWRRSLLNWIVSMVVVQGNAQDVAFDTFLNAPSIFDPDRILYRGYNGGYIFRKVDVNSMEFDVEIVAQNRVYGSGMMHELVAAITNHSSVLPQRNGNFMTYTQDLNRIKASYFSYPRMLGSGGFFSIVNGWLTTLTAIADAMILICLPIALSFLLPSIASRKVEERNEGLLEFVTLFGVTSLEYEFVNFVFDYAFYIGYVVVVIGLGCASQLSVFLNLHFYEYLLMFPIYGITLICMSYLFAHTQSYPSTANGVGFLMMIGSAVVGGLLNIFTFTSFEQPPFYYFVYPPFVLIRALFLLISRTRALVMQPSPWHFWFCMFWLIGETIILLLILLFWTKLVFLWKFVKNSYLRLRHQVYLLLKPKRDQDLIIESNVQKVSEIEESGEESGAGETEEEEEEEEESQEEDESQEEEEEKSSISTNTEEEEESEEDGESESEKEKEKSSSIRSQEKRKRKENIKSLPDSEIIKKYTRCKTLDNDVVEEIRNIEAENLPADTSFVVKGLVKRYGKKEVVRHTYFATRTKECFGLLGPNGAGKTTLLRIATGEISATEGTVIVGGLDVRKNPGGVRQLISVCPQFDRLWGKLSVREHLLFYSRLRGIPWKEQTQYVNELIEEVNLEDATRKFAETLSGGMRRRLSLAIALCGDPSVVLLDEPTSGLDPVSRHALWKMVDRVKRKRTCILTTHSMDEAEHLCDRISIMTNGKMRCLGDLTHLKKKFSKGYQLMLTVRVEYQEQVDRYIRSILPNVSDFSSYAETMYYRLASDSIQLSSLFEKLSPEKALKIGILDWTVNQASLEEVFLKFAEGVDSDEVMNNKPKSFEKSQSWKNKNQHVDVVEDFEMDDNSLKVIDIESSEDENKTPRSDKSAESADDRSDTE